MDFLFGDSLWVRFVIAFAIVLGLIALTAFLVRRFGGERLGTSSSRGRQPRLAVIDAAAVDGRRRLILIRRDNVEHLLMIGGPSDVVVEANIVRVAGARDAAGQRPGQPEALPRAVTANDGGNMWPLQPEPAPAPPPPSRPSRQPAAMDEPIPMQWNGESESPLLPPRRSEPRPDIRPELRPEMRPEPRADARPDLRMDIRPEPRVDMRPEPRPEMRPEPRPEARPEMRPEPRPEMRPEPRNADPLAGLAAELARVQPEPSNAKARLQPRDRDAGRARGTQPLRPAAPPPPADDEPPPVNPDQNLAEMAQRLEAALRRPKAMEARAAEAPSKQPVMPPVSEPMMQEPTPMSAMNEDVVTPRDVAPREKASPPQQPQAPRAATPKPQKSVYDSLEQEMASLLGRPNSKA